MLRVTAGADYDDTQQVIVPVNQTRPVCIEGKKAKIELNVRIQDFHGLPPGSPVSSPYFSAEPHASNGDQYSISFRFTPLSPVPSGAEAFSGKSDDNDREPVGIKGTDLLFGNDFDHPIRDRLPPGFNTAMSIVQWWIDPGLEGDAYADQPYLYGPALSSFNSMHVGRGTYDESKGGLCFDEGGDEDGLRVRDELQLPIDSKARMKWALQIDNKSKWTFEYGQTYCFDFFNSYLDFTNLAVRLPGFHLPILRYWDGQALRYEPISFSPAMAPESLIPSP